MGSYFYVLLLCAVFFLSFAIARFLLAVTFGRNDYRFFKEYRTSVGEKANWLIFLNHWLTDTDYKYRRAREEIYGEPHTKTNIKRFLFTILAGLIGFLFIFIFIYLSI